VCSRCVGTFHTCVNPPTPLLSTSALCVLPASPHACVFVTSYPWSWCAGTFHVCAHPRAVHVVPACVAWRAGAGAAEGQQCGADFRADRCPHRAVRSGGGGALGQGAAVENAVSAPHPPTTTPFPSSSVVCVRSAARCLLRSFLCTLLLARRPQPCVRRAFHRPLLWHAPCAPHHRRRRRHTHPLPVNRRRGKCRHGRHRPAWRQRCYGCMRRTGTCLWPPPRPASR
jgi:hypothetical protein